MIDILMVYCSRTPSHY